HLGVPVADMTFDGPYGVYHSLYDTHRWVAAIGDPGFRYHTALVQVWGTIVLRLANADVLPLDYEPYAMRIQSFVEELERDATPWLGTSASEQVFAALRNAARDLQLASAGFNLARDGILRRGDGAAF